MLLHFIALIHIILQCSSTIAVDKNCADVKSNDNISSGVSTVFPDGGLNSRPLEVYCDQDSDGGGWTVIQRRFPLLVREDFYRSWQEYVRGFGDVKGEFWLGLDNINALTSSTQMELRVDLEDWEGGKRWAKYGVFHVGSASTRFVLTIANYSGDVKDGMSPSDSPSVNLNGMKFSTHDLDNDLSSGNCAQTFKGGWWFNDCHRAHLNGLPYFGKQTVMDGISWVPFRGGHYSLKVASMKIRPYVIKEKSGLETNNLSSIVQTPELRPIHNLTKVKPEQTSMENWTETKPEQTSMKNWTETKPEQTSMKNWTETKQEQTSMENWTETKQEQTSMENWTETKFNVVPPSGIHTVYPFGEWNPKSANVFCDQVTDGGGWTVIQNREDLPVRETFERSWKEYEQGFGNLTGEFWLGLENIHALTSSAKMELRIDLEDWKGQKKWAKYENFNVGDSASKYVLTIRNFSGVAGDGMTPSDYPHVISNGMMFSTHDQDNDLAAENCALSRRGGWWFNSCHSANLNGYQFDPKSGSQLNGIIWYPFHQSFSSLRKTSMKIRPVITNELWNESNSASSKALNPTPTSWKNCDEIKLNFILPAGVRIVYPYVNDTNRYIKVLCDQISDEGGWTVIQNREDLTVRETFERPWKEYEQGFGNLTGEFWLGLENIHALTSSSKMELRIDLEDWKGQKKWAKYENFNVGDFESKYVLIIGNFSGIAGDGMTPPDYPHVISNGMMFSTLDQDNDLATENCALSRRGGWWFNSCHSANLNGYQFDPKSGSQLNGIIWYPFHQSFSSLRKTSMKIRPVITNELWNESNNAPSNALKPEQTSWKNCAEIKMMEDLFGTLPQI